MKKAPVIAALLSSVVVLPGFLVLFGFGAMPTSSCAPSSLAGPAPGIEGLTEEQATNARTIVSTVRSRGLPPRAAVIAIATAWQESTLRNLDYGDEAGPDSRGLFQQMLRYYGPDALVPEKATQMFLDGLVTVVGWEQLPLWQAAQAVQRSAHPHLYGNHEERAQKIVDQLWPEAVFQGCAVFGSGRVFVIGDSITVGATTAITTALAGRDVIIDAEGGRYLVEGIAVLKARATELAGRDLVVGLCTNYDGGGFVHLLDQVMTIASDNGAASVTWITCTEWHDAIPEANAAIRDAVNRYPTVRVAEWEPISQQAGMLAPDGVHLTSAGNSAFAELIAATLPVPQATVHGDYALPLEVRWYEEHPEWFTKPHHDYPAADIPVPVGTPVYAASTGVVASISNGGNCGVGVTVNGDDGASYTYCHGQPGSTAVSAGDAVSAGQQLMLSASTGNSSGPHLHFEINIGGAERCPQPFLVAIVERHPIDVHALPASGCSY